MENVWKTHDVLTDFEKCYIKRTVKKAERLGYGDEKRSKNWNGTGISGILCVPGDAVQ